MFFCKDLKNSFYIELYSGMLEEAVKNDYTVMIQGNFDFDRIRDMMVDGLLLTNEAVINKYLREVGMNYFLPAVGATFGSQRSSDRAIPIIECDLYEGCKLALEYLKKHGHKKIAYLCPYPFRNMDARRNAWSELAHQEMGSDYKNYYLGINRESLKNDERVMRFPEEQNDNGYILLPEHFFEKGELGAEVFLERRCDATAVLIFNDEMALGFCKRIRRMGVRLPEDLSVMSFDGSDNRKYTDYHLTTVAMNTREQGAMCVRVLLDMINGKKVKHITHIPYEILEGDTVRDISE